MEVGKGSNSGVLYMIQEVEGQPSYISAPEYQVLDNANHPDAKLGKDGNRQSASLYDMIPLSLRTLNRSVNGTKARSCATKVR